MRRLIVVDVYGVDLHLGEGDRIALHREKHVRFVFVSVARYADERREIFSRDRAKSRLRVGDLHSEQKTEHARGDAVALFAPLGNVRKREVARAEDHTVLFGKHRFSAGGDILRAVLPVAVRRDASRGIGAVFENVAESRL